MYIKEIEFDTINQVWQTHLWPGRTSAIEPYSAMMFMHDKHDISFSTQPRIFLGGYINDTLVAVNSVHLAEKYMARSRGVWVDPAYRGNGHGVAILKESIVSAKKIGAEAIWSFPRQISITSYTAAGFIKTSDWMNHGEFGPNCYAIAICQ
jgi:N-acetylglutamate synthase-like GNAT family acetyltransferase